MRFNWGSRWSEIWTHMRLPFVSDYFGRNTNGEVSITVGVIPEKISSSKDHSPKRRLSIRPRWRKVFSDLLGNRIRTILVVASIAVGLFAVGMIATIHSYLTTDMTESYAAVDPANIQVSVSSFDTDTVDAIKNVPGVADVNGVRLVSMRLNTGPDQWISVTLVAVPDFNKMTINRVRTVQGQWPPADHQVVFDLHKLPDANAKIGDLVEIKLPGETKTRQLKFVGTVQDQTIGSSGGGGGYFLAPLQGYITYDTLEWLDQPKQLNELYATVASGSNDELHIRAVADKVSKKLEDSSHLVLNSLVRRTVDHPNSVYVQAMSGVLFMLGFLVVFLSAFLITNTLSGLLRQQTEQIGVMKTVGARAGQIIGIYVVLILSFSLIALLISLPLSGQIGYQFSKILGTQLNFNVRGYRSVPLAVILQIVIALVVPLAAGILPIIQGANVTVQEAFNGKASAGQKQKRDWIGTISRKVRILSRPLLISLRNTFRRKGRLFLTLITLTLGGAIFIATFNVRASMTDYIKRLSKYFVADVSLNLQYPYHMERVEQDILNVPGVASVEGWSGARVELLQADDTPGEAVRLVAPPVGSKLIEPIVTKGRWILPGDQNAITLNELFISKFPNLKIGDTLRLRVNGQKTNWIVVGFFQFAGKSGGYIGYANFNYLSQLIHAPNQASTYEIVTSGQDHSFQAQKVEGQRIENYLDKLGYHISDVSAGNNTLNSASSGLNTLIAFLLVMAVLSAIVGSIGLMGTLSMNVMERTREIGVMRAIGASDLTVMKLVIVEGVIIGGTSWIFGSLLAFPISSILWSAISTAVFNASSSFTLTPTGFLIWLVLVLFLSILASVIPARNAAKLTIREILSYE
ncbi:MAG: FtsX-like permease family protein [Anaerolineaceae bacterium]|nr:FtsX-like permease family protein [Anaerolineaceae bacterium]